MDLLAKYLQPGHFPDPGIFAAIGGEELLAGAASPEAASERLPRAFGLVSAKPGDQALQVVAARLLELTRRRDCMLETWRALHCRFPDNQMAFRFYLRWLRRAGRAAEGCEELGKLKRQQASSPSRKLEIAELWVELGRFDTAFTIYRKIIAENPNAAKPRLHFARRLSEKGEFAAAAETLAPLDRAVLSPSAKQIVAQVEIAKNAMRALHPAANDAACTSAAALKSALLLYLDRPVVAHNRIRAGGVVFITGSLGAGGAERQLTRIASALEDCRISGERVSGVLLTGKISIAVTNASGTAQNGFFHQSVLEAQLPFVDLSRAEPCVPDKHIVGRQSLVDLLPILPQSVVFGLERLLPVLQRDRPEIAYIWQDGAVLMAALAALVAGVPRIVLSLRGMPPSIRANLAKDEFRDMYQTLARLPGVSFTANNRASANAYCNWLELPRHTFTIIANAAEPKSAQAGKGDAALWQAFRQKTRQAHLTLGGVFRFEPNKRPKLWLEFAAKALESDPRIRFILVGEGTEFSACQTYATSLGLGGRVLFVGHSHNVGFWLSKMDVLSLLSEHEGLPNALIEAQIAGVPVLSTPAGGAAEAFEPGLTGMLLKSAANPQADDYIRKLTDMTGHPDRLRLMKTAAKTRANELFAIDRILAHTMAHFKGQRVRVDAPRHHAATGMKRIA